MEEESLELDLSLNLKGLESIREYTEALKELASVQKQVKRSASLAAPAQSDYAAVQARVAPAGSVPPVRLMDTSASLNPRTKGKADRGTPDLPDVSTPRNVKMTREMQALYSTRINLPGGAAPLLGKTLDAAVGPAATKGILAGLAPLARVLGPIGIAFTVAETAVKAFYEAAQHSAEVTNRITSEQATAGGSSAQVSMLGLMGGNANAAKEFNDRITSDPEAMTAAARLGIHNLKGQYGNQNWTAQYIQGIEAASKMSNKDQRDRLAKALKIEQQVAKWALLSKETQDRMKSQAELIGKMNNPQAQKNAAEFEANRQIMNSALDNAYNSIGQSVMKDFTQTIISVTDATNDLIAFMKSFNESTKGVREALNLLPGGQIVKMITGQDSYLTPNRNKRRHSQKGGEDVGVSRESPLMVNTQALRANTDAMNRLTTNIGGGKYSREALAPINEGQKLHEAMVTRALSIGALG